MMAGLALHRLGRKAERRMRSAALHSIDSTCERDLFGADGAESKRTPLPLTSNDLDTVSSSLPSDEKEKEEADKDNPLQNKSAYAGLDSRPPKGSPRGPILAALAAAQPAAAAYGTEVEVVDIRPYQVRPSPPRD